MEELDPKGQDPIEGKQPEGEPGKQEGKQEPELKQFTQAQIDEMVKAAKAQVKKKYEGFEDMKKKLDDIETAQKQKELDELDELTRTKKILEEKEAELERLSKEAKLSAINTAFEKAAREANVPEKYLADAKLLAGINDETDVETIAATVAKLVEAKPFLVEKKEVKQQEIGGGSNPEKEKKHDKTKEQLLKEAADKAKRTGRTEDKIAYVALKRELG